MTKETDEVLRESKALMSGRLKEDSNGQLNLASTEDPLTEERNLGSPTSITPIVREIAIDFLKDNPSEMTVGRRIARGLMDKKWYNPRAGQPEPPERSHSAGKTDPEITEIHQPSLNKAWAYFEHVALSRHFVEPKEKETTNICLRIGKCYRFGFYRSLSTFGFHLTVSSSQVQQSQQENGTSGTWRR
jgi:hypothetical protein